MLRLLGLIVFLLAVIVLMAVVLPATAESQTDGLADAEPDESVLVAEYGDVVVYCGPPAVAGQALVVGTVLAAHDGVISVRSLSAPSPRSPPSV